MGRNRKHSVDDNVSVLDTQAVMPVEEDSVEEEITEPVSPVGSVVSHTETELVAHEDGEAQEVSTSCADASCVSVTHDPVSGDPTAVSIDISGEPLPKEVHIPTAQIHIPKKDEQLSVICRITGVPLYGTTRWPLKTGEKMTMPREAALHFSRVGMVRILK